MAGSGRRTHYRKHLTDAVLNDLPEPDEGLGRRIALVVGTRGGNMFDVVVAPLTSSTADVADDEDDDRRRLSSGEDVGGGGGIPPETTASDDDDGEDDGRRIDGRPATTGCRLPPIRNVRRSSPQLAFLPTKFRKLVWIKRNDFVIVECGDEEEEPIIGQGKSERGERPSSLSSSSSSGGGGGGFRYVITNILYRDQVRHIKSRGMWPSDPLFADDVGNDRGSTTAASGGTRRGRSDRGVGGVATGQTVDDDCRPDDGGGGGDDDDGCESPSDDRDGAYEEGGIVFDDPLGGDELLTSNTNRVAALRVMDDSSSEEEGDSD